jgi:myo-inositol-1(or 4)-monophosphatase
MDNRLKVAQSVIIEAGEYLRKQFLQRHRVSIKEDKTVLLGEDIKSEEILLAGISQIFPTDTFLTEETETKFKEDNVWVFDPLCGSYSYLRGVETWSISMAYISGGEYKIGLVYQPYSQNLFYCEKGKGAYMNKEKIHPSPIINREDAFVSIEHGVFLNKNIQLQELIQSIKRLRVGHGSGGELSYVAAGFLDAVIKTDQALMHFAGGRAIVEEAGGAFIDFSGEEAPTYFDRKKSINYIACANISLAEAIRKMIVRYS